MAATIGDKKIGPTGYGLMGLTWRPNPITDEQAIQAMKAAPTAGANLWNGGEFYGKPDRNSLIMLNKYFARYPQDANQVVINIKGALDSTMMPDCSPDNIRRSVDNCLAQLDGKKSIDVFECARVDPEIPIEDTIKVLAKLVGEGKIGAIGLSKVNEKTIRRASKVHPIASVEVELSLWSTDILFNGVSAACAELNIPVLAYSPLGRGMLTGELKSTKDLAANDWRKYLPRFQAGAFESNIQLVESVQPFAQKKGSSIAQLSLAWIRSMSGKAGYPTFIPITSSASAERIKENMEYIVLTPEEFAELDGIVKSFKVSGGRYGGKQATVLDG